MKPCLLLAGFLTLHVNVRADTRSSADYAITTETIDSGGRRVTSADYSMVGSVAPVTGVSSDALTPIVAKHGYIGQLYDLLGYGLLASNYYPPEVGSTQLIPARTTDDGTNVVIPTTGFTFAPLEGPIAAISPGGLVETASIYQDTLAIVGTTSPLFAGQLQLQLHVLDTIPDNYSTYAADGLPDAWQILHFGLDNPLASPLVDADHDGQDNRFEYTAGLLPLDPSSRFRLSIEPVPGQPGQKRLVFTPRLTDRAYSVKSSLTLPGAAWAELLDSSTTDDGEARTVTDLDAAGPAKFYHVEITKP